MYILVIGNPIDGLTFNGLFARKEDATSYGEHFHPNEEWWIVPLVIKEKESNHPLQKLANILYNLIVSTNNDDIINAHIYALALANQAIELHTKLAAIMDERTIDNETGGNTTEA